MKNFLGTTTFFFTLALVVFGFGLFGQAPEASADDCVVNSAKFREIVTTNDPETFFSYAQIPVIYVDFQTTGCQGGQIESFSIVAAFGNDNWAPFNPNDIDILPVTDLPIGQNDPSDFTIVYRAGETGCVINWSWDCEYYIEIEDSTGIHFFNTATVPDDGQMNLTTTLAANTMLTYECEPQCNLPWQYLGLISYGTLAPQDIDQYNVPGGPPITLQGSEHYLAPLPGFSPGQTATLGGFLKSFFTLLIVIAGILAFLMIVIGAIRYASVDSFSNSESGKDMMMNAIMGLILALGAWIILNAINPNLASNLGITIPTVYINPEFEPETGIGTGADGETITLNVAGGGTTTLTACDETRMEQVTAFGKTFKIYEGLVSNIQSINTEWLATPEDQRYEVKKIGGYNCRRVKGTNTWSAHAYGLAVDINQDQNPFSPPSQNQLTTDMPPEFREMWTSHGWGWGGSWTTLKDAMHFSKYPTTEGGNGLVSQ